MLEVIYDGWEQKIPIKSWCSNIEEGALKQAINLANLPFAFKHIALMPDTHQGYGMPIGGVLAAEKVVIPNCVGVDIGCGVCALNVSKTLSDIDLKKLMSEVRKLIPLGFNKHKHDNYKEDVYSLASEAFLERGVEVPEIISNNIKNAVKSAGTLGGGNHFLEFQQGNDGNQWIMIHSGSRNLGKQVADYYNKLAVTKNEKWFSEVPKKWQLAFLPLDSEEGQEYLKCMEFCVEFAFLNRQIMMDNILKVLQEQAGYSINGDDIINIAHNYARLENHFGKNVVVHRKGATLAREETIGLIPGSQGTSSYIVKGKGNPESFMSCSHGAGRLMSRKKAKETLSLEDEKRRLDDNGIIHSIRTEKDLDEATGAYKNITEVMENQSDLVDILVELKPLAVIKG